MPEVRKLLVALVNKCLSLRLAPVSEMRFVCGGTLLFATTAAVLVPVGWSVRRRLDVAWFARGGFRGFWLDDTGGLRSVPSGGRAFIIALPLAIVVAAYLIGRPASVGAFRPRCPGRS